MIHRRGAGKPDGSRGVGEFDLVAEGVGGDPGDHIRGDVLQVVGAVRVVGQNHAEATRQGGPCGGGHAHLRQQPADRDPPNPCRRRTSSRWVPVNPSSSVLRRTTSPAAGGRCRCQPACSGSSTAPGGPSFCRCTTSAPARRARASSSPSAHDREAATGRACSPLKKPTCASTRTRASTSRAAGVSVTGASSTDSDRSGNDSATIGPGRGHSTAQLWKIVVCAGPGYASAGVRCLDRVAAPVVTP